MAVTLAVVGGEPHAFGGEPLRVVGAESRLPYGGEPGNEAAVVVHVDIAEDWRLEEIEKNRRLDPV